MGDLVWPEVWADVANDLGEAWTAGFGRLVTEDVLRFSTVKQLVGQGVPPGNVEIEWRRPDVRDSVDLVVNSDPMAAIEFKYPREPREVNAAWTQHLGEMLKDFYRLAHMPANFEERWCVQLVSPRVARYLSGVGDRHGVDIARSAGHITELHMERVRGLPRTATRSLERWLDVSQTVRARCVGTYLVGDLTLAVHEVDPAILHVAGR